MPPPPKGRRQLRDSFRPARVRCRFSPRPAAWRLPGGRPAPETVSKQKWTHWRTGWSGRRSRSRHPGSCMMTRRQRILVGEGWPTRKVAEGWAASLNDGPAIASVDPHVSVQLKEGAPRREPPASRQLPPSAYAVLSRSPGCDLLLPGSAAFDVSRTCLVGAQHPALRHDDSAASPPHREGLRSEQARRGLAGVLFDRGTERRVGRST